jgi:ABC-type uncharacterized transport system permease subunit
MLLASFIIALLGNAALDTLQHLQWGLSSTTAYVTGSMAGLVVALLKTDYLTTARVVTLRFKFKVAQLQSL